MSTTIHTIKVKPGRITLALTVTVLSGLCAQTALAGVEIELLQRQFQARFHYLTKGNYVVWPPSYCTPTPLYPPDHFYGDLDKDKLLAASLVQDLAKQFYGRYKPLYKVQGDPTFTSAEQYPLKPLYRSEWVNTQGELEGTNACPGPYLDGDFPATGPGFDLETVTTNNYLQCFGNLSNYVNRL